MKPLTILCDVDGVIANMLAAWLARYNAAFHDNLTAEDITDWSIEKFVKPECGKFIYTYLNDPSLYNDVQPIPDALSSIDDLRRLGHRVVFLTAGVNEGKLKWLLRHKFIDGGWQHNRDVVIAYDKSLINGDLLIDDAWHNVNEWGLHRSILYSQPHNRKYDASYHRAENWQDVCALAMVVADA